MDPSQGSAAVVHNASSDGEDSEGELRLSIAAIIGISAAAVVVMIAGCVAASVAAYRMLGVSRRQPMHFKAFRRLHGGGGEECWGSDPAVTRVVPRSLLAHSCEQQGPESSALGRLYCLFVRITNVVGTPVPVEWQKHVTLQHSTVNSTSVTLDFVRLKTDFRQNCC